MQQLQKLLYFPHVILLLISAACLLLLLLVCPGSYLLGFVQTPGQAELQGLERRSITLHGTAANSGVGANRQHQLSS